MLATEQIEYEAIALDSRFGIPCRKGQGSNRLFCCMISFASRVRAVLTLLSLRRG